LDGAVDGGSADGEQFGKFGGGVFSGSVQLDEVCLLGRAELGRFAPESAFGFGDFHALPGSHPDEVGFEFGDHGQDVEQQPSDRVVRVVDRSADVEFHLGGGEFLDDVPGVGQGSGQPIEFGDDQGVPGAAGGECLAEAGSVSVAAGETVVDVVPTSAQRRLCRRSRYADWRRGAVGVQGDRVRQVGITPVV